MNPVIPAFEAFSEDGHQGFVVKFANGFVVSVVWHKNNTLVRSTGEKDAEIAIIDLNGTWDVHPHSTPEQVAQIMAEVSQRKG